MFFLGIIRVGPKKNRNGGAACGARRKFGPQTGSHPWNVGRCLVKIGENCHLKFTMIYWVYWVYCV